MERDHFVCIGSTENMPGKYFHNMVFEKKPLRLKIGSIHMIYYFDTGYCSDNGEIYIHGIYPLDSDDVIDIMKNIKKDDFGKMFMLYRNYIRNIKIKNLIE